MKKPKFFLLLYPLFCLPSVRAGTETAPPSPAEEPWLLPTLQIRGRYEHASVDAPGIESSDALTLRERVGLTARSGFGLSAGLEGEFTQVALDHYDASAGSATSPENPTRTQINDPENAELNQAWIQYSARDTDLKVGRQRIVLDNAAIVGNSGWRQNEQTYDGVSLQNRSVEDLTLFYSYISRVNRIFGNDAVAVQEHLSGDVHLFNAKYEGLTDTVLTGYVYLMDFSDTGSVFSNDTLGFSGKRTVPLGDGWKGIAYGEVAWQADGGNGPVDYEAWYGHFVGSVEHDIHTVSLGYEHLGAGDGTSFHAPLSTAHAFNGFSDTLVGARLGGTPGGIGDLYVAYDVKLPWSLNGQAAFHWLGQDDLSSDYGRELDLMLSKKFDPHFLAILKFAFYDSDGPTSGALANPAPFDASRCSVELNYTF